MNGRICFTDADVLVNAFVNLDEEKNRASRNLLGRMEQGEIRLLTDALALAESYYVIEKYKGMGIANAVVRRLLSLNNLEIAPVDSSAFFEALKRAGRYQLKINDLIHYTVALLQGASGFYSYDKDFNGLEIKRMEP